MTYYKIYKWSLLPVIIFSVNTIIKAEDLRRLVNLEGTWKFTVGDDSHWSAQDFNDSQWDDIYVPQKWEDAGYNDYNGFGWYRTKFKITEVPSEGSIYLVLGHIDDIDEVYLNGKKIGGSGSFPPNIATAYDRLRKYRIPVNSLNKNTINTIAVRVYDYYMDGGIVNGDAGIYVDEDYEFMDVANFEGPWKFHTGDNKLWISPDFNDDSWKSIFVPSDWEWQGYENYDGYGWYRKKFYLTNVKNNQELYLSLGKIDDYDYVYINGKLIGQVFDLKKDGDYKFKGYEFNARRIYPIPNGALKNGANVISIRVLDKGLRGGIYEGPIGIMTTVSYKQYRNKYYEGQSFWEYIMDEFIIE